MNGPVQFDSWTILHLPQVNPTKRPQGDVLALACNDPVMPSGTFRRVAIVVPASVAGALALGVRANYISLIRRQGVGAPVVWFSDGLAISSLVLLFAPLWSRPRRLLLIVSGVTLTGFALLSGFTIGYQLVPSVVLTGVAIALASSPSPQAA